MHMANDNDDNDDNDSNVAYYVQYSYTWTVVEVDTILYDSIFISSNSSSS